MILGKQIRCKGIHFKDPCLFIEPHSDDIFLSLGYIVSKYKFHKKIITIYGSGKRINEAKKYAYKIGAEHESYGINGKGDNGNTIYNTHINSNLFIKYAKESKVFCPFGLQHPEHIAVRIAVEQYFLQENINYYLDMPYAMKIKNSEYINKQLETQKYLLSYMIKPPATKYNHIPIFRTQSMFFYYNNKDILKFNPEIILRKVDNV